MANEFFPKRPKLTPSIYAYEEPGNADMQGFLKVGFTNGDVQKRVAQQYPTAHPGKLPYRIVLEESAMKNDGSSFTDHDVHRLLRKHGFLNPKTSGNTKTEWFKCSVDDVRAAILALRRNEDMEENRTWDFKMRPEQEQAVEKTAAYFDSFWKENKGTSKTPHFLWNAKMRFGKTFAAYQLANKMGWKKVLVLTFKPAVQSAWEEDLKRHIDFAGWQFISRNGLTYEQCDKTKPFVCFGSFQD
ncbi:MAG: GIY-YIG nuclease family protein, partial [Prevotellaceae bacterium]|nr:GIY-YIG nuclease family protein [Prevotellaceae bacterium]